MLLIIGLGNPGKKYEKTRHNLGFRVVDALRDRWGLAAADGRFDAEMFKGTVHGRQVLLAKPQTFMNLSGVSAAAMANYFKIAPAEELWVVHDDLDLPPGTMRIRVGGSAGGHRGVQSVIERLGHGEFVRFRLGIGRPEDPIPVENYVVEPFAKNESAAAEQLIKLAAAAIDTAVKDGLTKAMNLFNG